MKRFFFVLSVILVALMVVTVGASAALHYGAIWAESKAPAFYGGWNVTEISFTGRAIIFPAGDLHVIRRASASDVAPGDVVLFSGGSDRFLKSGYVEAVSADAVRVTTSDGTTTDESAASVKGVYRFRIPRLAWLIDQTKSPAVIGGFTIVLLVCIILWRKLPGGDRRGKALSESDEDIATILY